MVQLALLLFEVLLLVQVGRFGLFTVPLHKIHIDLLLQEDHLPCSNANGLVQLIPLLHRLDFGRGLRGLAQFRHIDLRHLEGLAKLGVVGVHGMVLGQLPSDIG